MPIYKTPFWDANGKLYRPRTEVPASAVKTAETGTAAAPSSTAWPDNFPGASDLQAAGVKSAADAQGMSRDDLLAIDGIGPKTADAIAAFKL
jgi:predicted flap endonuclease-1-like 5' DNA nuclease